MERITNILGLVERLAEETRRAVAKKDLETALPLVVQLALQADLGDFAGVTQRRGVDQFETVGASHPVVLTADRLQYELDEGPCVRASYEDGAVISLDVESDERWPRWGPTARSLGVTTVLSVHLYTDHEGMGALNIYSAAPRRFDDQDLTMAQLVAAHASVALAHFRGEKHLWRAIDARHRIGVAQGIIMREFNVSLEQALSILQRVSRERNIKMHAIAAEIIDSRNGAPLRASVPDDV